MLLPTEAPAALLYAGRRTEIGPDAVSIGRGEDNDVVVSGEKVSRRHARVERREDGAYVSDLGSRHGTTVNGEPLGSEPRLLESGDAIEVGGELVRFLAGEGTRMASRVTPATEIRSVRFEADRLTIGRDAANDLVLSDPNVSRFHAEIHVSGDGAEVVDLGSRNGTRLDGRLVERAPLERGSSIGIGPYRLVSGDEGLVATSEAGSLRLEARAISVQVGEKKTILQPASLSLEPGELVAIIGESGAGKSTMLKVLAGVDQASDGAVTVNGEPVAARLTDVAYVPQDDIVHSLLGVREALGYAARLRLPQDAEPHEVGEAIDAVLEELALEEHAETRVGRLSGGQRRRTSVAAELLGKPGLVFLDEPTTGMDPGLETKMMELFRELADGSRGVALVTHATKNLALCDRVVVMGRGGRLVFDGPPKDAAGFFGVDGYDGIYTALDEAPEERWPAQAVDDDAPMAATGDEAELGRGSTMTQISVLVSRYLKLLVRDRKNMALLIGQAPILALAGVGLFNAGILDRPGGSPFLSIQFLFLAGLTVLWLGAIDAAQEVVKERAVLERERAVGVKLRAYLASKLIVLFGLVTIQTLLYAGLLLAFRPLDADFGAWAAVFGLLVATGCVAVCMGLAISAISGTPDQAMSFVPLAVIPQLLFAGAIVPVQGMAEPAQTISYAIFAQWWLAASGTAVDMNARIAEARDPAGAASFGTGFFDVGMLPGMAVLLAFAIVFLGACWLALRERRA